MYMQNIKRYKMEIHVKYIWKAKYTISYTFRNLVTLKNVSSNAKDNSKSSKMYAYWMWAPSSFQLYSTQRNYWFKSAYTNIWHTHRAYTRERDKFEQFGIILCGIFQSFFWCEMKMCFSLLRPRNVINYIHVLHKYCIKREWNNLFTCIKQITVWKTLWNFFL